MIVVCPNHEGGFDCTPFCPLCEGNQEMVVYSIDDYPAEILMGLLAESIENDNYYAPLQNLYEQLVARFSK